MKRPVLTLAAAALAAAAVSCGDSPNAASTSERIDPINRPEQIDTVTMEKHLSALPSSGAVPTIWNGYWWPDSAGGTAGSASDPSLSPMEKHDLVAGNSKATAWERADAAAVAHIGWAGHCNGAAAAGIMEKRPLHAVQYQGVTFSVSDIQALLSEAWIFSGEMAGGRCDAAAMIFDAYGRPVNPACRDLNPGTFHIALANEIGRYGKGVIIDVQLGLEVWNYPIRSYSSSSHDVTKPQAVQLVGASGLAYPFNPQAVRFAEVTTSVEIVAGTSSEQRTYRYLLELDAQGTILGGEWLGGTRNDHPDFIWRPSAPKPANPFLNLQLIKTIHSLSVQ